MMRMPMPKPACARGAERPAHDVDEDQVHGHQRELGARWQPDRRACAPDAELRLQPRRHERADTRPPHEVQRHPDDADRRSRSSVEIAAPATPSGAPVTQPKISNGASTMLMITVAVWTTMPGLKLPVPRSAAPIATSAELQRHRRDEPEQVSAGERRRRRVRASAVRVRQRAAMPTTRNSSPTNDRQHLRLVEHAAARARDPCGPRRARSASSCRRRASASAASTMNIRLPASATPATASVPSVRPSTGR